MGPAQLLSLVGLLSLQALASPVSPALEARTFGHNDFSCKSTSHPNPVILLHGLGATYYEDINALSAFLKVEGFCTFSITYGAYEGLPALVGGLKPIAESSQQIADFIKTVKSNTGANKVDLVGHSEGAFQTLYTAKFGGVASDIDHIVAIAPPTHGTTFAGLYNLAYILGNTSRELVGEVLQTVGCGACDDLGIGGDAVKKLNDGKIVQGGNKVTIITSRLDELVTPTKTAFVEEDGVNNIYIQDYCPLDPAGHIGEAYDLNVWNLVLNSLEDNVGHRFFCLAGFPGK